MDPIPDHFKANRVGEVWRVPYADLARSAQTWARSHSITPAVGDGQQVCLVAIDVQNTFCIPGFELYVGGASGLGAVEDTTRLCEFIYRNLGHITEIVPTMDTHRAMQIFHPMFWINAQGEHPTPIATMITLSDVESGVWRVNPAMVKALGGTDADVLQNHGLHYTRKLTQAGKYPLTIWPYHSMLGGIGHALVPAFEAAAFFHGMARSTQPRIELKGDNPLTENYSVLRPEVMEGIEGPIAQKNTRLIQHLLTFDKVIIAGQAKSHCVAWTIADLLTEIENIDPKLAQKVYLLDDCASPVVVPGVVDFTAQAEEAYGRFAAAGMKVVRSTEDFI
jgi:nicotinamidase-related amidase